MFGSRVVYGVVVMMVVCRQVIVVVCYSVVMGLCDASMVYDVVMVIGGMGAV